MTTLTKEQVELLEETYKELERTQLKAIRDFVPYEKHEYFYGIFGLDPKLDKEDTINDQHKRRSLT